MSKKVPTMADFVGTPSEAPSPIQSAEPAKKAVSAEAPRKSPGRPKKAADDLAKQTAIRLDPEDLRRIKKLAIDDTMTFNRVVYRALEAYCETRGVKLIGASKK